MIPVSHAIGLSKIFAGSVRSKVSSKCKLHANLKFAFQLATIFKLKFKIYCIRSDPFHWLRKMTKKAQPNSPDRFHKRAAQIHVFL